MTENGERDESGVLSEYPEEIRERVRFFCEEVSDLPD
jgi:hypothetical protein